LHIDKLHNLCFSAYIAGLSKQGKFDVLGHVASRGQVRNVYNCWLKNLLQRDHLKCLGIDVRIILNWSLKNLVGKMWPELICLRAGTVGSLLNTIMKL
jgi:hypothetical protein